VTFEEQLSTLHQQQKSCVTWPSAAALVAPSTPRAGGAIYTSKSGLVAPLPARVLAPVALRVLVPVVRVLIVIGEAVGWPPPGRCE